MELVLGFAWFFGSLYALISLFRPLPPFRSRKQAALGLGGFQVLLIVGAGVLGATGAKPAPSAITPATSPPPQQPQPSMAGAPASSDDPSWLVRTKPGEKLAPPVVAPADVAAFRAKAGAGMKTLDAAELVLENAVQSNRVDLVRDARNAAQEVSLGMITDRQPFAYTEVYDRSLPCQQAASALAAIGASIINDGGGTAAVEDRIRLNDRYESGRDECAKWLK